MFGPLFRYELTRLARRGLQPRLRAAFAGLLLVALLLAYLAAFPGVSPLRLFTEINEPLSIEAASRFGERFVVAFLIIQTLVVVLVTPALVAGAIGEEKDRRSLDLLLTTPLTDREIVVGKLAARLAFIGMLLLTGLPVVVLTIFFGGVDLAHLVAGYVLALFTMCSLGALSLSLAVWRPTLGGALVRAYLVAVTLSVFGLLCSCFHFPAYVSPFATLLVLLTGWPGFMSPNVPADPVSLLAWYGAIHLGLAALFVRDAARQLRDPALRIPPATAPAIPTPPRDDDLPSLTTPRPNPLPFRDRNVPEVDDADPLGWKERYFGGGAVTSEVIRLGAGLTLTLFLMLLVALEGRAVGGVAALVVLAAGMGGMAAAGFRAAGCVARERQHGTLDGLLTLPVNRRAILFAKARVAATPGIWLAVVAMVAVFLGVLRGGLAWPVLFGVPVVLAGWLAGVIGFGIWLSVRCATRERAVGWFLGLGLVACVLMPLFGGVIRSASGPGDLMLAFTLRGFSPIVSLWDATPMAWDWQTSGVERFRFQGAVAAAIIVGVLGVVFGARAVRDFERDAGGRSA